MNNHPKIPQIKFLHVYTVSKRDTLLKDASPEGKPNRKWKSPNTLLTQKDPRRYGYLKLKSLLMQVCLKSIHQREKKWYLDSDCSKHMTRNKSWFRNLRPKDGITVKFAYKIKSKVIDIGNVGKNNSNLINDVILVVTSWNYNMFKISLLTDLFNFNIYINVIEVN